MRRDLNTCSSQACNNIKAPASSTRPSRGDLEQQDAVAPLTGLRVLSRSKTRVVVVVVQAKPQAVARRVRKGQRGLGEHAQTLLFSVADGRRVVFTSSGDIFWRHMLLGGTSLPCLACRFVLLLGYGGLPITSVFFATYRTAIHEQWVYFYENAFLARVLANLSRSG